MQQYKQLTYEQRCQIEVLKKSELSQQEIAGRVGTSQSTISRELARNTGLRGYRHKQAQRSALLRRKQAHKPYKMTPELIAVIEGKLGEKWSPEQVAGWLSAARGTQISHERIYLHVWSNKAAGGDLYRHLRRHGKRYHKRCNGKTNRGQIKNRTSIEERPAIVDDKNRIGDWEIDTVIGRGHSGALVTIVERATQFTLSSRVSGKTAVAVTAATIELLRPYSAALHTITADNGKDSLITKKLPEHLARLSTLPIPITHGSED